MFGVRLSVGLSQPIHALRCQMTHSNYSIVRYPPTVLHPGARGVSEAADRRSVGVPPRGGRDSGRRRPRGLPGDPRRRPRRPGDEHEVWASDQVVQHGDHGEANKPSSVLARSSKPLVASLLPA